MNEEKAKDKEPGENLGMSCYCNNITVKRSEILTRNFTEKNILHADYLRKMLKELHSSCFSSFTIKIIIFSKNSLFCES